MEYELKVIDKQIFKDFLQTQERYLYTQTAEYVEVKKASGKNFEILGLFLGDECVLACIVSYLRFKRFFKSAEIVFGPIFDETKAEYLAEFLPLFKKHAFRRRAIRIRIVPFVQRNFYEDIEKIGENPNAAPIITAFAKNGFKKLPYDFYSDIPDRYNLQPTNVYVKDLAGMSFDDFLDSVRYMVRKNMSAAKRFNVRIKLLQPEELDQFEKILEVTSERLGVDVTTENTRIIAENYPYAFYPLAYLDTEETIEDFKTKIAEKETEIKELDEKIKNNTASKKSKNKKQEREKELQAVEKRLHEVNAYKDKYGEVIPMATGSYYASKSDLVYLQGGMIEDFANYFPVYAIMEYMVNYAIDKGIRYFNFFGISGDNSEEASDYGVLQFKRAFNGKQEEYLGTYEYKILSFL